MYICMNTLEVFIRSAHIYFALGLQLTGKHLGFAPLSLLATGVAVLSATERL